MPQTIKYIKLIKFLQSQGFYFVRSKGSHERYINPDGRKVTIPKYKEIPYGTYAAICEQIKLAPKETLKKL